MKRSRSVFLLKVIALAALAATFAIRAGAQTETIIHAFTNGTDGGYPSGALVLDSSGNLYGATISGGSAICNCGTALQFVRGTNGTWTPKVLYNFGSFSGDGWGPNGSLTFDSQGNLYGTTWSGGATYLGTVFELSPGANGTWTDKVLYNFTNGSDGFNPSSGVMFDKAGNLYGIANGGTYGFGVIFELVAGTNSTWKFKVLYNFQGNNDGAYPSWPLVLDPAGGIYGVAGQGGAHDYGLVFKLAPDSNGNWAEKVLHVFPGGSGGGNPTGGLIRDSVGNLYGITSNLAYELSPNANGSWAMKTLHHFAGGTDGATAESGLVLDVQGNLYGTTYTGGSHRGTVFELSPQLTGTWSEKILHKFSGPADGVFPQGAAVTTDASGNIFGTTQQGGASKYGVLYEIVP